MAGNEKLIAAFEDTEAWYNSDAALQEAIANSISGTKVYREGEIITIDRERSAVSTITSVSSHSTFDTARWYKDKYPECKVAVLNFASSKNPGGGVKLGSHAQEEALCRCSTLYPVLKTDKLHEEFYKINRERADALHTDDCIYTPEILIIKPDKDVFKHLPQDEWVSVDVISCAAPCLSENPDVKMNPGYEKPAPIDFSAEDLFKLHVKRAKQIINVAAHNKVDILILGAFGCGAFRNDPEIVAKAYAEVIPQFNGYFREINFAVIYNKYDNTNYETFARAFK